MESVFSNLSRMIEQVSRDKGIDRQIVIDAVVNGLLAAARKKWGTYREIEAQYNEESGEVELIEFKEVVKDEEFIDPEVEIKLSDALELDPAAQVQDSIGVHLEMDGLGRIAAHQAKHIINQKVRDAEKEVIFAEFGERQGEVASGIARRQERGAIVVDLGRTEACIPFREQIPGEQYRAGDRVQGYILEVRQLTRGPQIVMSRASEKYMVKLFESEVPEIYDGVVEIVAAAREPGARAKIAVVSKDTMVDPVGACVGMKGCRVQNVVQELNGEKIDIIHWDEDPTKFVCSALAPAEVAKVFINEEAKEMQVVVPDEKLSLAIGRKGQNVRLASKLTGWNLDIVAQSKLEEQTQAAIFNLQLLPGVNELMARSIFQGGFASFEQIAQASVEEVVGLASYEDPEKAAKLIASAQKLKQDYESKGTKPPSWEEHKEALEREKKEALREASGDSAAVTNQEPTGEPAETSGADENKTPGSTDANTTGAAATKVETNQEV